MKRVSGQRGERLQSVVLREICFSLIHRKALFEYLRAERLGGADRRHLLSFFHRTRGYTQALVEEHDSYLGAACSYVCSSHVGSTVIRDGTFQEPMLQYEELYRDYFRLFCEGALDDKRPEASTRSLLPYLKYQIAEYRKAILQLPRTTPSLMFDSALREPTGDTAKLRADVLRASFRTSVDA